MTKKNAVMTTRELAAYIKLNEKTVIKLAKSGDLPAFKVGNKWRFLLSAIDMHLQPDILTKPVDDLDLIIRTGDALIPLSRLTEAPLIELDLKAKNRDALLRELATVAHREGLTQSVDGLFTQLKKREQLLSTGIGNGVAIPHARNPHIGLFTKSRIIIARSRQGVPFKAPDNKKVHLFFMTCPINAFAHMRILAKIAKMLHVPGMIEQFIAAPSKNAVISLLLEAERHQYRDEEALDGIQKNS